MRNILDVWMYKEMFDSLNNFEQSIILIMLPNLETTYNYIA